MTNTMSEESLKEAIKRELPNWLREDPSFRAYVLDLARDEYADRRETNDRFYALLDDLRRERERQDRKWAKGQAALQRLREEQAQRWEANQAELERRRDEQAQKWEEQAQRWDANQAELERRRDEQAQKWEEQAQRWEASQAELKRLREEQAQKWEANQAELKRLREEQAQKWEANQAELERRREEQAQKWEANQAELERRREEQAQKWEAQERKWEANQVELKRLHEEAMAQASKLDRTVGALGARWGLQSEKAFRDALAGILEESFGVQVIRVNEYDDSGEVFGRPDQVELDVIIKNGHLVICELKSSIDKAGMYSFERKARFYERLHERRVDRLIVISPMIDPRARKVAERLGIETYGDSIDVASL